jgi:hypothetical protein
MYGPDLNNSHVREALSYGNPYGVGISGSTNVFLFAADHFNKAGATRIDGLTLTTAMAALLCYDGGHSLHEAYAAAKLYPSADSLQLGRLAAYQPGDARQTFVTLVNGEQSGLVARAFERLAHFLLAQPSLPSA